MRFFSLNESTGEMPVDEDIRVGLKRARKLAAMIGSLFLGGFLLLIQLDRSTHEVEMRHGALTRATTQANLVNERLEGALSSTYALATVLRQYNYTPDYAWMEPFARELLRYHPGVSNVQFSPGGVTRFVVPLAGNEKAIGNNLLLNSKRNKEALQAVASRQLTMAGPFELVQGGMGVVGRLPIFVGDGKDNDAFWGFAVALVRVDDMLRAADIDSLVRTGYDYSVWRNHPDTGKPHVFAKSGPEVLPEGVTLPFKIANGSWQLTIAPRDGWTAGVTWEFRWKLLLAFAFSATAGYFCFFMLRQPVILRAAVHRRTLALTQANLDLDRENQQRAEAQSRLKLSDDVIEASAESIMITDADQRIIRVNRAFKDMTGYRDEEVLGRSPSLLNSGRHDAAFFHRMFETLKREGSWQGEVWNRRKNAEVFPQWMGISALTDPNGIVTHYVSIGADITERKDAEERIHYLAHYDTLTGLPNRLLLRDRFQQAIALSDRNQTKVALLSIDLDRFKVINDTMGHQVGDELLRQVVGRLKSSLRSSDTISRQGGDEFIIVTQDHAGANIAATIARNIQESLAHPFEVSGQEIRISASIGIALYPEDGKDFDTLIKKCDIAMYHAKESGRATHRFFTEELNVDASDRMQLERELRRAIDRQEFLLYFQPQVSLDTGKVTGAEALVRWSHPEKGLVPPGRFIPLAEETGLIVALDNWVLREACRQAKAWVDEGLPKLTISVNFSGMQFRQTDLVERVRSVLEETGHPAEYLEVELTESVLIHDVENVLATISRLKGLGIRLAIDDFGTGYSSLAYLKRFSVDKLKIDQSFVRGASPEDAAIVSAVIQLGHSLNLKTIAEGAETLEQVQELVDKGCGEVQGYYFSKPLPVDQFAEFLRQSLVKPMGMRPTF